MDVELNQQVEEKDSSLDPRRATQISMHSIRNLLSSAAHINEFDEQIPEEFAKEYGVDLSRKITTYGFDLTDLQCRVMEAILNALSRTHYQGNTTPQSTEEHARERFASEKVPESYYKNIASLPRLRITQAELRKLLGTDRGGQGYKDRIITALRDLGSKQYCLYYNRLAYDADNKPKVDSRGRWVKEEVMVVDTVFTVKEVTKVRGGKLDYYEVTPSPVFLDQLHSYFVFIPNNWREELQKLVGRKKGSSYMFRFLLYLLAEYETRRRSRKSRDYVIRKSPRQIAISLRMPYSIYERNKMRATQILDDCYSVAKKLGYLLDYAREANEDILHLNVDRFYSSETFAALPDEIEADQDESPELTARAEELLEIFMQHHQTINPRYSPQGGRHSRMQSINILKDLLSDRSLENLKRMLNWGLNQPYWCNQIDTPSKFRKNCNKIAAELQARESKQGNATVDEERVAKNRDLAEKIAQSYAGQVSCSITLQDTHVLVCHERGSTPLGYREHGFKDQLETLIQKFLN